MLLRGALVVVGLSLVANQVVLAQGAAANGGAAIPRTPDGRPDLQGIWTYATVTPLERPPEFADKPFLTEEEGAAWVANLLQRFNGDTRDPNPVNDLARESNQFWQEPRTEVARINGRLATSLIVDPPNGRVPLLSKESARPTTGPTRADNPEDRGLGERCLVDSAGPPIVGNVPNSGSYLQIIQTLTHIVLYTEVSNTARIVPLAKRDHNPGHLRRWRGDSVGQWDGETLIVETVNFKVGANLRGYGVGRNMGVDTGADMRLIERFSLAAGDRLVYDFTVDNPKLFARSWTAQLPMTRSTDRMFENACHEGNISLEFMLRGARAEEKK